MTKVYLEDTTLTNIGDAIREKKDNEELLLPSEMPNAIKGIQSGAIIKPRIISFDSISDSSINLDNINTSNISSMSNMFNFCENVLSLDVSNFDTSKVINMSSMFNACRKISSLDVSNFDTSNVTNMSNMFTNCNSLASLDLSNFNTSRVKDMGRMFYMWQVTNLTSLNMNGLDASNVIDIYEMFGYLNKLEQLQFMTNLGKGFTRKSNDYYDYTLNLQHSVNLTHESLMDIINKLYDLNLTYDVANGGTLYTQQLIIGPDNILKCNSEEVVIATDKGWTVS